MVQPYYLLEVKENMHDDWAVADEDFNRKALSDRAAHEYSDCYATQIVTTTKTIGCETCGED